MADNSEYSAVATDENVKELVLQEGEDIDYRIVFGFYLLADISKSICALLSSAATKCLLQSSSCCFCSHEKMDTGWL